MAATVRWTTADLEGFPDSLDDTRYEIIGGELYVSRQPRWEHQYASSCLNGVLATWSFETGRGVAVQAPGIVFTEDENVAPDVVWISHHRLRTALRADGKLHEAPELIAEVLSPGAGNETRDRETKLKLYAQRGVDEYWIVDWQRRRVEVYRRDGPTLSLVAVLDADATLGLPLLPGFRLVLGLPLLPGFRLAVGTLFSPGRE